MEKQERRAPGVARVPLERVVEICGRDDRVPAFEAESVELSGRGMHVRTPYLPEIGAPLVCRLEDTAGEVVVEGIVAWARDTDGGGEFGVKFTALDSGSVETLKGLCGLGGAPAGRKPQPPAPSEATPEENEGPEGPVPGAPVKLHIEGLGSPMKARVRHGSIRGLHVGSNLEFLKVGRTLEIEDVQASGRRGAQIDSVSIAVDPQTQVPQLVVTLRYEGAEDVTPEPSVIDGAEEAHASNLPRPIRAEPAPPDDDVDVDEDEVDFTDASPMRQRLETFADEANRIARSTGVVLARAGAGAAVGMGHVFRSAGEKFSEMRAKQAPRRTTSPAPKGPIPQNARRLRPQSVKDEPPAAGGRAKKVAIATMALGVLLAGSVMVFRAGRDDGKDEPVAKEEAAETAMAPPAAKMVPAEKPAAKDEPPRNAQGMVADVPLFGPTPMATIEPAPLGIPEDEIQAEAADAVESNVPDESFDQGPARQASVRPEDVKPWGQGRLHLPFVHRLKLDAPGVALSGEKKSTGFSVLLPKRKVLDSGRTIAKRDDRITNVKVENTEAGARVTFVFSGKIPPYKVRLKGQYVEFFVSSPNKS